MESGFRDWAKSTGGWAPCLGGSECVVGRGVVHRYGKRIQGLGQIHRRLGAAVVENRAIKLAVSHKRSRVHVAPIQRTEVPNSAVLAKPHERGWIEYRQRGVGTGNRVIGAANVVGSHEMERMPVLSKRCHQCITG